MKKPDAETIARIEKMEQHFDLLCNKIREDATVLDKDEALKAVFDELIHYYTGGQWLRDYELDERGLLPKDLKRGVLSQDGVYDLLCLITAN